MFSAVVLPPTVSLFSSTNSLPLQLFSTHVDPNSILRSDSFIHLIRDDTNTPSPPPPGILVDSSGSENMDKNERGSLSDMHATTLGGLCQTVLHIQSPTLKSTFIRCPPVRRDMSVPDLDITLPWVSLQVRTLGSRAWAFEVGFTDRSERKGVVRCSTFQKTTCLKVEHKPPLLHVPIYFKSVDGTLMSGPSWSTVSLNLQDIIHQFAAVNSAQRSLAEQSGEADDSERIPTKRHRRPLFNERADDGATITQPLPSGAFGKVLYIKVYANCRLRRIWFSNGAPNDRHPWEFDLYGAS